MAPITAESVLTASLVLYLEEDALCSKVGLLDFIDLLFTVFTHDVSFWSVSD